MLIFQRSVEGRVALGQWVDGDLDLSDLPEAGLRQTKAVLPEVSELQVVRHYTGLSQRNFGIDTHFYPLGSCTMKYNPRGVHEMAMQPQWLSRHPLSAVDDHQSFLKILFELQQYLSDITGMPGVSLTPMAGSQGEFVGVAMIKAYHDANNDTERTEMIVPTAAHGTNPASAVMCGYTVKEIPTGSDGNIDVDQLREMVGPKTAGIMLTNPSTLGIFSRRIKDVSAIIHEAGGLLYYDGANLNAILGKVRPGDMGFDVMHLNLHKTFATPHGGGGPGAGPVAVADRLKPYLPIPTVVFENEKYRWTTKNDSPDSIGRLSCFMGNAAILLRAYLYIRLLGRKGLTRVADFATLNANYIMKRLQQAGFECAFPDRRASHEFVISFKKEKKQWGVSAMDIAKRLLDYGCHAPTTYFPLSIPECFLIEPTETESKQELDHFIDALIKIRGESETDPELVKTSPHTCVVKRLDDVKAVRELNLTWKPTIND